MACPIKIAERLLVWTALGEREIQLCFGDITALPATEQVDFIMVSAFLGDYSAMRGTVIGALKHNLGIDVRELAMDKLEDLRLQFNCWISRKLKPGLPYRQLICFEKSSSDMTEAVKEVFRAMMPAFNNMNKTVITPLLGTGHQNANTIDMLNTMVWTAAKWMWLGMPLQQLKIVIYSRNPFDPDAEAEECLKHFQLAKEKIRKIKRFPVLPEIKQTIYLIFCEADMQSVDLLVHFLRKKKTGISLLTKNDITIKERTWQHDLSEVLLTVSCVIPVMSSKFLQDGVCIDEFNVALCCNRLSKRNLVLPSLVEKIQLPAYMNMFQWIDCRLRKDDQFDLAANFVIEHVSSISSVSKPTKKQYDVFISYCHKNIAVARKLVDGFQELDPPPKIFFDYDELTAGVAWQQALYESVDNSRCMIAMISHDYQESAICKEELHLGLAKHFCMNKELELILVCIDDTEVENLKRYLRPIRLDKDKTVADICASVGEWLSTGKPADIFTPVSEPLNINYDLALIREHTFIKSYELQENGDIKIMMSPQTRSPTCEQESDAGCDVFISHSLHDQEHATFLEEYLKTKRQDIKVYCKSNVTGNEESLIRAARCTVVLLSSKYVKSVKEVEEFNVLLSKERQCRNGRLLYIVKIKKLLTGPMYFKLVPCDTSLCDDFWCQYGLKHNFLWQKHDQVLTAIEKKLGHGLKEGELCPLLKAACDILMILDCGRYLDTIQHSDVILHNTVDVHLQALALQGQSASNLASKPAQEQQTDCDGGDNVINEQLLIDDNVPQPELPKPVPVAPPLVAPQQEQAQPATSSTDNRSSVGETKASSGRIQNGVKNGCIEKSKMQLDKQNSSIDTPATSAATEQKRSTESKGKSFSCLLL